MLSVLGRGNLAEPDSSGSPAPVRKSQTGTRASDLRGGTGRHDASARTDRARSPQQLIAHERLWGTCSLGILPRCTESSGVRLSQTPKLALDRAVRLRREEIGMTQEALADAAGLDATSIGGLERGVANPTWDVADRVSRTLGLALHELARMADELETKDWRPTNEPIRQRR